MAFSDIDTGDVASQMMTAAAAAFGEGWDKVRAFVKIEFKTIARRIKEIAKAFAFGDIDEDTARLLVRMQRNNSAAAIAATTTMVLVTIENIINAALAVVKDTLNAAIGFTLL